MYASNRDVLKSTAARYVVQARRVLHFMCIQPLALLRHKEVTRVYGRNITLKPKKEYFALE